MATGPWTRQTPDFADPEEAIDTPSPTPTPTPNDKVQSTATSELLAKLATAPKLDAQRFVLEGEVGQGGMGVVLKIHDRFLNRRLAMKVLIERAAPRDEEERQLVRQLLGRFLEEAQVTSQLDHPGVVPVHELGLDAAGKVYFTMRLVKGRTASEVFADAFVGEHDWPLTRALEVVLKVCDTMAYAHDKGVLHRDLKPSNVMVGRFGEVYVMDWGLAKVIGQADRHDLRIQQDASTGMSKIESARKRDGETDTASSVVSMDGQQLGTPSYMSPEQARSEELDQRTDVYAIGAILYELLTGRAPYTTAGVRQPAYRILNDVVDGPCKRIEDVHKGVPAELVAIVERAMARDRNARYPNVLALAADVRAFLAQRVVRAYRTGALVEMKLWMRRNKALAASLAAAGLLLVLGIAGTTTYAREADQRAQDNQQLARSESASRQQFATKVKEFDQLALVVSHEALMTTEPTLTPGWPDQLPAIDAWLGEARALLARRDELTATLMALQQRSPLEAEGAAAAGFLARSLEGLRAKLPQLEAMLPSMQKRREWARRIGPLTLEHPSAKVTWTETRAAIAKADGVVASTLYAGQDIPLRDEDVLGLVPIAMNAESKLWEFYDLRSAWDGVQDPATLAIPAYDANGRLEITGQAGIVFVLIPRGTLPPSLPAKDPDEKRRLAVQLDPFLLGKYEVTQGQWLRWTGKNPSETRTKNNLALPVERVSWFDADPVLRGQGMLLPSELQWEYGIRAGTTTRWWTGDDMKGIQAKENLVHDLVLPVGSKDQNGFGLFDMGGNLMEWCADELGSYGTERNGDGRRQEPLGDSLDRGVSGSGMTATPQMARSGSKVYYPPVSRDPGLGLRAVRALRR